MEALKHLYSLTRFQLCFAVALSGVFPYVLAKNVLDFKAFMLFLTLLCIACAVTALNQIQERDRDAKMLRTKNRVLVSGSFSLNFVKVFTGFLLLISLVLFYSILKIEGVILFILTIILYNGLYTYLKPRHYYAVFVGAILGVIPPVSAWLCSGLSLSNEKFFFLGFTYFIWQIPHFWLLNMIYEKDYKEGGFKTFLDVVSKKTLCRLTFFWICFSIVSLVSSVSFFDINYNFSYILIMLMSAVLFVFSLFLFSHTKIQKRGFLRLIFILLTAYITFAYLVAVLDKLI